MRFLFYRYNNICEPDILEAFEILGHEVDTITLEIQNKTPSGKLILDTVLEKINKQIYDGIFSVNFYPILAKICEALRIRYFSWTTDCPVDELFSEEIKSVYNRTFCFDYSQYSDIYNLNSNCIFYMPLATNVSRWDKVLDEASDCNKWKSDISFVGSLYTEKVGQEWFESSAQKRLQVIKALGNKYDFALYTGSDTDGLPVRSMGRVKTHTEMPLVFNNSKINLNITCSSIRTGVPQRVWDVLGCKGFLLTNYQEELSEYFEIGRDLEVYESIEDLLEKADYYLKHDDIRNKIAENGYRLVKSEHTFTHRLADIVYISYNT